MTIHAWRLVKAHRANDAFSGEGASRYPGRWNRRGVPVVYTAGSLSLAALEVLANLDDASLITDYVSIPVSFDERLCQNLDTRRLPNDWRSNPAPTATRDVGSEWALSGASCILRVPSAIIPSEFNYLINPGHRDFTRIKVGATTDFTWDNRLI
ncbi:MAG: hypothetical protein AMXMBFR82_45330 [Candidatus Hydrogenedentota bacterium]